MVIRNNKAVTYELMQGGRTVYIGITNDPRARFGEHKSSGKQFQQLRVTSRALSRWKAGRKETGDLMKYKRKYGYRPIYNHTWNGKFNQGW